MSLALAGRHQLNNAAVALAALEVARPEFPVSVPSIREGLATVCWPGRLETALRRPTVILDGAHNEEGVAALVAEMRPRLGARKAKIIFAVMGDKNWRAMLAELSGIAAELVLTRVSMERSADPSEMAAALLPTTAVPVTVADDARRAVIDAVETAAGDDVIVVTGSLYFLGEVRPALTELAARQAEKHSRPLQ